MDIADIKREAIRFNNEVLDRQKKSISLTDFKWYPYSTIGNFYHLEALLTGKNRFLLDLIGNQPTLDIGCADGDLAYFLESLGCEIDVIDYAPTNFNHLQGARRMKQALASSVTIHDINLDSQFAIPRNDYGLVFFLGILYHLKNPFYVLETLARNSTYCLLSTRIAKFDAQPERFKRRTHLSALPVAYLLDPGETNNDASNYWIFSDEGLRRILKRTGWEICDYLTVGDITHSDPVSNEGDERAFCLAKSCVAH